MKKPYGLLDLIFIITLIGCSRANPDVSSNADVGHGFSPTDQNALSSPSVVRRTLTVFAAASLTGAFQEIGKDFEANTPGVSMRFNFAGSQILRVQIEQGASADVFASADHKNIDMLVTDRLVALDSYQDFVTNKLVVILPVGNPGKVDTLGDLARPHLKLVLADASVPAGNYARQILTKMSEDPTYGVEFKSKVLLNLVSNETDVKQVVAKVELGEADAGIVYHSDAIASPGLIAITIPDEYNVTARYPIAILTDAPEAQLAEAFIAFILSPAGQEVLSKWGFTSIAH